LAYIVGLDFNLLQMQIIALHVTLHRSRNHFYLLFLNFWNM